MSGLSPEQRQGLRPYVESGFLTVIEDLMKQMAAPYWWYDPTLPRTEQRVKGGTLCVVNTGERILGITAGHVHDEYFGAKANQPKLHCQIGAMTFEPERYLVDVDERLDIAVYGLSQIEAAAARVYPHTATEWPPKNDTNQAYFLGGWLWELADNRGAEVDHYFGHFIAPLTDTTTRSTVIEIKRSSSVPWGEKMISPETNLGGMSGGPVYRLKEQGLVGLHLVGIISEYAQDMETIIARPLSLVTADGNIIRE